MSETTPVHTGTDRVELTDADKDALCEWSDRFAREVVADDAWPQLVAAVESIVADRLQALTAERDFERSRCASLAKTADAYMAERDAARAELAAANARTTRAEAACVVAANQRDDALREIDDERQQLKTWREAFLKAESQRDAANARCAELEGTYWHEELGKVLIKNKALQATLDRVVALADEWDERAEARRTHKTHREWIGDDGVRLSGYVSDNPRNDAEGSVFDTCSTRLRAALTPEGTE